LAWRSPSSTKDRKDTEDRKDSQSIVQFARYGILRAESGEFAIADGREFLKEHGDAYKKEISPFTRTDMPPELLPEVPNLHLLGKLFEKRCDVEVKLRKAVMLYLNVKHGFDATKISNIIAKSLPRRQDRPDPAGLCIGRSLQEALNEVYTSDLKAIVLENWNVFGTLFDNHKSLAGLPLHTDDAGEAIKEAAFSSKVDRADGLVIVAPEYNHGYSGLLNTFLTAA
jgi:hypothetical protein